jgi:alcohol dehydrogenase, propanol-preferring
MQALQLVEYQRPPELRDVPVPEPGPGQVRVKIGGAGACHSDLHLMDVPANGRAGGCPSRSAMKTRVGSTSWGQLIVDA